MKERRGKANISLACLLPVLLSCRSVSSVFSLALAPSIPQQPSLSRRLGLVALRGSFTLNRVKACCKSKGERTQGHRTDQPGEKEGENTATRPEEK